MRSYSLLRIAVVGPLLAGCSSRPPAAPTPEEPPAAAAANVEPAKVDPQPTAVVAKPSPSGPPVRDLARQLLESDGQGGWRKNEKAATELEKLSADEVKQVWPLLKDADAEVRRGAAVFLLPLFDPTSSEQVGSFSALLDDSDRIVRARAIDAVRQFSKADQLGTLPKLILLLDAEREDRPENRAAIARLCGSLKREAESAVAALASAARYDPDAKVRSAALGAAVTVATTAPVMQALRQGLSDKEVAVRLAAASRLRQLGVTATSLAPELAKTLGDADQGVAENAAEALIAIGTPAVEPLAGQLQAGSPAAKKLALAALATLGPVAKAAVPAIEKCRQDSDMQVRQLAEAALKRIQ
jgi:HEAT repeat protein